MKLKQTINNLLCSLLVALLLASCVDRAVVFDNSVAVNLFNWSCDSAVQFDVEILDTTQTYQMGIRVRNQGDYAYQNLWLFVEQISPDSTVVNDTVQFFLADEYGRWLGSGVSSLHSNLYLYQDSLGFENSGTYTYRIKHGMRHEALSGIKDIGLKVVIKEDGEK